MLEEMMPMSTKKNDGASEDGAPDPAALGARVRERRLDALMSMRALAAKAGVSFSTLHRVEHGLRPPEDLTVWKLARALDCSPADLLAGGPDHEGAA